MIELIELYPDQSYFLYKALYGEPVNLVNSSDCAQAYPLA